MPIKIECRFKKSLFRSRFGGIKMPEWGDWELDTKHMTLDLYPPYCPASTKEPPYFIHISRIDSTAEILDWLAQLSHKGKLYGQNPHLGLFEAFDDLLQLQSNCCSWGKEREFDALKLVKEFCQKHHVSRIKRLSA